MEEYFKIERNDLISLVADSLKLTALETDGVDSWSWYGECFEDFIREIFEENSIEYNEDKSFKDAAELIIQLKYAPIV